ncbi:MAG: sulfocyanin-like copper-binding protein [Dongiaceae bacterium]
MLRTFRFVWLLAALALGGASAAHAAISFVPTWIENDPASRRVRLDIAADWNDNNAANCGNLNGYFKGGVTVLVPAGWDVTIDFHVIGDKHGHSLMLTRPFDAARPPIRLSPDDAVGGVHTRQPLEGLRPGENDQLRFPAVAGSYWLVSAKGTDLAGGLWIRLEVQEGLGKSEMVINNERIRRGYPGFVGRM